MPWLPRAALVSGLLLSAGNSSRAASPSYSAASVVNSATNTADALAPNTIASIYGVNLSYDTAAGRYDGDMAEGRTVNKAVGADPFDRHGSRLHGVLAEASVANRMDGLHPRSSDIVARHP